VADGRYLARDGEQESVLVLQTLGAPPPPLRRRRRPSRAESGAEPLPLPLTRVTAIRAFAPFESEQAAVRWLDEAVEAEETIDVLLLDGVAILNRALYAQAAANVDPYVAELQPEAAAAARIGYGSGDELAAGHFTDARNVDARASGLSRRRRRDEELRPQERIAAVLGGRARIDACEGMLLRARGDLDAGREREAALQLRVGLEALLVELKDALTDPEHDRDMGLLHERRSEVGNAANQAIKGDLDDKATSSVRELLEICERVLRRRRVLRE
jgi:hypothetical protein